LRGSSPRDIVCAIHSGGTGSILSRAGAGRKAGFRTQENQTRNPGFAADPQLTSQETKNSLIDSLQHFKTAYRGGYLEACRGDSRSLMEPDLAS
jgi:hypothetical protein